MSSIHPHQSSPQTEEHDRRWRVILVGRTGLDQLLRRDGSIELIRARDTIDAIGELSDPIDARSPARAVVLVAASIEPADEELARFIDSLRLIDQSVRVLGVGTQPKHSVRYDGWIDPHAELDEIIDAIQQAQPGDGAIELRFVSPGDEPEALEVAETNTETNPEAINVTEAIDQDTPASESQQTTRSQPEVVVVARNEDFEHRAMEDFTEESEIHKQVLIGIEAHEYPEPSQSPMRARVPHGVDEPDHTDGDGSLVEAMLSGRSVLEAAIRQIGSRLGRDDITFVNDKEAVGVPVMVGDRSVGKLVAQDQSWAMGIGHTSLAQQACWLSGWVRLELQQSELRQAAFTDMLTGAWNRRYFTRFLDAAIAQSRSARQPLSVMLFDIDDFKRYNDTYGHAAGDEILVETVKLLTSVIRPSDRVCRVGGDEFVVIFYEPGGPRDPSSKPLESVYQIATRFQQQICTHRFPKLGSEAMGTLTVSGGLASFPWDGHDSDSLLEKADQLAMESKRCGKNAITLGPGAESTCNPGQ